MVLIKDMVYVYRLVGGDKLAWHGRYHTHDTADYELHLFLEGSGKFLLNRSRYAIEGNRLFITRPREFHSILPGAVRRPISYYAILFEAREGEDRELLSLLTDSGKPVNIAGRERFLVEDLYHLTREPEKRRAAEYLLSSLLFRWYGCNGKAKSGAESPTISGEQAGGTSRPRRDSGGYVDRGLALMEKSVREKLNVASLADRLGLSEEHFIRIFHRRLGITPFQYFTRLKIEAASSYISGSRMKIKDIADHFGFENPFHFSRIFKKCTGLSPLKYRETFSAPALSANSHEALSVP